MNKVEINKYIESIIKQIPVVNSYYTDDVYEIWNGEEVKFGSVSFCITSSSISDNTTTWTGIIYYGDRLLEDKSNRDAVQTDAINVINAVMSAIAIDDDIVSINYPAQVELFEQKFVDYLAGGYANIQIETPNSISKCGYGYIKEVGGCGEVVDELHEKIEELNEQISSLEEQLSNCNQSNDCKETIDILNNQIRELDLRRIELEQRLHDTETGYQSIVGEYQKEVDELRIERNELRDENNELKDQIENNINPDYTSIGYNMENDGGFFEYERNAVEYAKKIKDEWDPNIESMYEFYNYDKNMVYMPYVDTSNVINMSFTFRNSNLKHLPLLDTSNVKNWRCTFMGCKHLETIPQLDFSNAVQIHETFAFSGLKSLPLLDWSNVESLFSVFDYGSIQYEGGSIPVFNFILTELGGFIGLKADWIGLGGLAMLPNLTVQSLLNVFNTMADVNELGGKTLQIGELNLAKLTDEQKKIATDKGWTLN